MRFFKWITSRPKAAAGTATAGVVAATVAFVGPWEGLRTTAYPDALARNIPTVCYGETRGVRLGDSYTKEECDAMLEAAIVDFRRRLVSCIPTLPEMPQGVQVAFTSWAYNVGTGAACNSTLAFKANAGDLVGACNQLPRWTRANGKFVQGLANRRGAERKLCLGAVQ